MHSTNHVCVFFSFKSLLFSLTKYIGHEMAIDFLFTFVLFCFSVSLISKFFLPFFYRFGVSSVLFGNFLQHHNFFRRHNKGLI